MMIMMTTRTWGQNRRGNDYHESRRRGACLVFFDPCQPIFILTLSTHNLRTAATYGDLDNLLGGGATCPMVAFNTLCHSSCGGRSSQRFNAAFIEG